MLYEIDREIVMAFADRIGNGMWIVYGKEANVGYVMMFDTKEDKFTFIVVESSEDVDKLIKGFEKLKERMEANE